MRKTLAVVLALTLMLLAGVALGAADKRDITVVNKSGESITEIYIALAREDNWGEDVLGEDVLENGESVNIHFSGYKKTDCHFDLLAKNEDGDEWQLNNLNLCEVSTVTITSKQIKAK